ncbi:EthD family reductase [Haloarchaeobius amylolyticus]|uniref:EthD family reductase n=1 Tax=Haloarchaeobius amylolyticus TaxID=1198296 RepID=A0ABD6BCF6_9EURY
MTCKMIILSPRKEGLTHEECIEYLEQEHVSLVEELPGLKRFTTSIPFDPERIGYPLDPDGTRFDVMAKLQFESLDDLQAAFDSEPGQAVLRDAQNFVDVDGGVMIAIDDETLRHQTIPADL